MPPDIDHSAEITIRLDSPFDGIAARRVEAMLAGAPAGRRVLVDLRRAGEIHDFALAVLAHALTRTLAEVTVRGLRQHQVRVLRYCGVQTERLERASMAPAP